MRILGVLSLFAVVAAAEQLAFTAKAPRPLVIWHGLGDTAHSEGIDAFSDSIRDLYPGIYIHSIAVPTDGTPSDDQRAGWWGEAIDLSTQGCEQINAVPELEDGFDAIGFSQGGLFLRWYAQFCEGPRMRNLITVRQWATFLIPVWDTALWNCSTHPVSRATDTRLHPRCPRGKSWDLH